MSRLADRRSRFAVDALLLAAGLLSVDLPLDCDPMRRRVRDEQLANYFD